MRSAPQRVRRLSATQRLLWTTTGLVGSLLGANNVAFAQVLPTAGDVVSTAFSGGNAPTIANPTPTSLSVALDAKATVINWKAFSIPDANTGDFNTARVDQITVLNRVVGDGGAPLVSQILGSLTAANNISVFLVNPSGVTFGPNGNYSGGRSISATLISLMPTVITNSRAVRRPRLL
jgi:filamentous hemagglutinin family protein